MFGSRLIFSNTTKLVGTALSETRLLDNSVRTLQAAMTSTSGFQNIYSIPVKTIENGDVKKNIYV